MTGTVNGIGTHLSGERKLTEDEIKKWSDHFPYHPGMKIHDLRIATESFVIFFLPLIPIKTIIFYYLNKGFVDSQYMVVYHPAGKHNVYWKHVKSSPIFFIWPAIIIFGVLYFAVSSVANPVPTNYITNQATDYNGPYQTYNNTPNTYPEINYPDTKIEIRPAPIEYPSVTLAYITINFTENNQPLNGDVYINDTYMGSTNDGLFELHKSNITGEHDVCLDKGDEYYYYGCWSLGTEDKKYDYIHMPM